MEDVKKWLFEGVKAALRFLVAALVPVLLETALQMVQALSGSLAALKIGETEKWMITLALIGADKAIHEWKKNTESEGRWKGLIGF